MNFSLSKSIDFLRFPLIVLVVFIHNFGKPLVHEINMDAISFLALSGADFYNLFRIMVKYALACVAVPAFFFISGVLYFKNIHSFSFDIYKKKTIKRLHTLLIPYLLWNLLAIIEPALLGLLSGDNWNDCMNRLWGNNFFLRFWVDHDWLPQYDNIFGWDLRKTAPALFPFWYVRDLIVVCLLAPVIFHFAHNKKLFWIIIIPLLFFNFWPEIPGLSQTAICFFSLGAFVSIHKIDLIKISRSSLPYSFVLIGGLILVVTLNFGSGHPALFFAQQLLILCELLFVFALVSFIVERDNNDRWMMSGGLIFFIYALHSFNFVGHFDDELYNLSEGHLGALFAVFILLPFFKILICIMVYHALKFLSPKITLLLTGR